MKSETGALNRITLIFLLILLVGLKLIQSIHFIFLKYVTNGLDPSSLGLPIFFFFNLSIYENFIIYIKGNIFSTFSQC